MEDQEDSLVFFSIIVSQNVKSGQAEGIPFPLGFNGGLSGFGFFVVLGLDLDFDLDWVWI